MHIFIIALLWVGQMTGYNLGNLFTLAEMFNRCARVDEVKDLAIESTSRFGVEFVLAGKMPDKNLSPDKQMTHVLFGLWPEEWTLRYFKQNYLEKDPTITHTRRESRLLQWDEPTCREFLVMKEAQEFRLRQGITIPMISVEGTKLGMSFSGDFVSSSPEAQLTFQVVSALATARALEVKNVSEAVSRSEVSPSERACLEWVTEGKTNWEIGMILGISEKTVEKHLCSCMRKTNSVNRTQLVANALRNGILH